MKEQKIPSYKYCCVPTCSNTTITAPNKIFFSVPRHQKIRMLWCKIMKREPFSSSQTNHHCCEDHFDLDEDMANYFRHKLVKSSPRLKPNVTPHKFECQKSGTSRKKQFVEKKYSLRKQRLEIIEQPVTKAPAIEGSMIDDGSILNDNKCKVEEVISREDLAQANTESLCKNMSDIPMKYEFPVTDLDLIKKESDCEEEQDVFARVTDEWPESGIEYIDVTNIKDEPEEINICETEVSYSSFHCNLEDGIFFLVSNLGETGSIKTKTKDKNHSPNRMQLIASSTDRYGPDEKD